MEQRRLRLGDILDDYCPRERRVTNHAVVAMIEEDVKQTRCTTCDAEHAYKGARVPRRRVKDTAAVQAPPPIADPEPAIPEAPPSDPPAAETPAHVANEEPAEPALPEIEEGPVHRPLIRATLPRPEGQKDTRPVPEFTVRQSGSRANGQFRGGDSRPRPRGHSGNGNRAKGGPRFGSARPAGKGRGIQGRGPGGGFRSSQPHRHGGKKRSR